MQKDLTGIETEKILMSVSTYTRIYMRVEESYIAVGVI